MNNFLLFFLVFSFFVPPVSNGKLWRNKLAPVSSFAASGIEPSLLTEAGTPYSVYGVFGRHATKEDGIARVEQLKKIFDLARKTNKKIIFFQEKFFNGSADTFKKVEPRYSEVSSELIEENMVRLSFSDKPEDVNFVKKFFRISFEGQRKGRKERIKVCNKVV